MSSGDVTNLDSSEAPKNRVLFIPFTTFIDPTFWSEVNKRKVNEWQLDESPKKIVGNFSTCGRKQITTCTLNLSQDSLSFGSQSDESVPQMPFGMSAMIGVLHLTNTRKQFLQELDRKAILRESAEKVWSTITSKNNEWLESPSLLNYFYLTAWADIKQFTYYYWNCIPVIFYPNDIVEVPSNANELTEDLFKLSVKYLDDSKANGKNCDEPFVILNGNSAKPLKSIDPEDESGKILKSSDVILVFPNPSSVPKQPAWPLRNLLAAVAYLRRDWRSLRVLTLHRSFYGQSYLLNIEWNRPECPVNVDDLKFAGWEKDSNGVLKSKSIDLKSTLDPAKIMEASVDLNLNLIRWRQAPTIQLERFTQLKALVVGSGTLGCNIARCLLGWGVKRFTFLDHATVSYNNPIRQSLFTYDDCLQESGSYNKATAAATALKRIYPSVMVEGIDMKIPMPGHPYSDNEKESVKKVCEELDDLIRSHDAIFLVMDSRESRWLPTLIASVHNKLALTVALGFDSYVVIRHGASHDNETPNDPETSTQTIEQKPEHQPINVSSEVSGSQLGCYFCSDVTAPGNSVVDRTLDQQCTISRSGVSMIASGMAVELIASVLQHPLGQGAPARLAEVDENASLLGATPHQLRGFLSRFHTMTPTVRRFERCTACGTQVRKLYAEKGFDGFLHEVFNDPSILEQVTGLAELQQSANELQLDMLEFDDEESI
ncbi:thiF family domain-containing protein [Ditylenchus destructor]|uniref:Ubiquitin-like modifier-activating enzyme ATG7 n=1 Tax=Ditylenchus destructor TaxID=166010 RepID=A0AAD4N3P7_9BILA|nr:thiF family domain-containing protein [Ditylenchus destructor]